MTDATSDTDTVTLDVALNAADYTALSKLLARGPQRALMLGCRLLTAVALCTLMFLAIVDRPFWAFVAAEAAVLVLALNGLVMRRARFALVGGSFAGHYSADALGMTIQRPDISSRVLRSAYEEIVVTPERIVLRLTAATANVIPTRCFQNPNDRERFLSFARTARNA